MFLASIRMKFVMLMVALGLVAFIGIANFGFPRISGILTNSQTVMIDNQLEILSDMLLPFLIQNQFAGIHETLNALQDSQENWVRIVLYNDSGIRIYPLFEPIAATGENLIQSSKEIEYQDFKLGTIHVTYDISSELQKLKDEQIKIVTILLSLFLTAIAVLFWILDWIIVKRIRVLESAASKLADGDYEAKLPKSSGDEIGWLANGFEQMRQQIFDKESKLKDARQQAEAAAVSKSQFLATMSHEIRTPLNGVIPVADLLLQTELDHKQRSYIQTIQTSGRALKSIIDDILDLSKLEFGEMKLRDRAFDMHHLLQNVQDMLLIRAQNSNLQLILDVEADARGWFFGDDDRIRQVLINLVGNAIKFTQEGSVRIRARAQKRPDGLNDIEIKVTDTGIGISEDQQKLVFKSFAQVDSSSTRQVEGTGLGLSICEAIMDTMGGQIGVDSVEGEGSTFWIKFVLPDAEPVEMEAKKVQSVTDTPAPLGKLKFLVVDDNHINLAITSEVIRSCGHEAQQADGGEKAIAMIQEEPFDLILMDVQMPKIDGLTAARMIRELDGKPSEIPIIGYSASAFKEDREKCLNAGMNTFLAKPLARDKLLLELDQLQF